MCSRNSPEEKRTKITSFKIHGVQVLQRKAFKTPKPDAHQGRQHTNCFANTYKTPKKSCRVFLFLRQVQLYQRIGKKLRPPTRR